MDGTANDKFAFNKETEFIPVLGLIESQLNTPATSSSKNDKPKDASSIQENHHPALLSLLSSELSVAAEQIYDLDL